MSLRLLVDVEGMGNSGDTVAKVDGTQAAHLVQIGRAEVTNGKPSKAARPLAGWGAGEVVLS